MRDPHNWMWAEACKMLERMEKVQRDFFRVSTSASAPATWQPPVDVYETDRMVWVLAALPGVQRERMNVGFENGYLIVVGLRELPFEIRSAAIHRLEIPHGRFERHIPLPLGRYELAHEELRDGMLIIGLRKLR